MAEIHMRTMVIAACNNEDTSWLSQIPGTFAENGWMKVVNSSYHPHGREAYAYLDYIVGLYNEIKPNDEVVFCQGDPFKHDPNFVVNLQEVPDCGCYGYVTSCQPNGIPHCDFTPLHEWCNILKLPIRDEYRFVAGAQYRITGHQIKKQTHEFYKALYYLTMIPNNKSAWVLERLWPEIWGVDL